MHRGNKTAFPQSQQGVAAIFAAVAMVTLLSAVTLAIDVGRLYSSQRQLQRMADLAAIDGARVLSQCLGPASQDDVTNEVAASLQRNRAPADLGTVVRLGTRQSGDNGLQYFQVSTANTLSDSVQVSLTRPSPARILPLFAGDDARKLSARAAAQSDWAVSASIGLPIGDSVSGSYESRFIDTALRTSLGLGSGGSIVGADVSVEVADLVNAQVNTSETVPDILTPTPVPGLLSDIAAQLDQAGDSAASSLVDAFATAVAAGRPGATVVPAEVLGLPLQGGYDGATAPLGQILSSIAGAVSQGEPLALGRLCDLLPLDDLPTAEVLPALCDSTIEVSVPQPGRPGTFNSSTQILDVNNSSDDAARGGTALVRINIRLVNPVTGQPISVPLKIVSAQGAKAKVTALSCARVGQADNEATVVANGATVRFAIADSGSFADHFGTPATDLSGVLYDSQPVQLLSASVGEVLTAAGLGSLVSNPLTASLMGQPVTVTAYLPPIDVGDGRSETFCMYGPPANGTEQCNGAPARVGGTSAQDVAQRLPEQLGKVQLSVTLPPALPPILQTALQSAVDGLTSTLTDSLGGALDVLAAQFVPLLQAANVSIGESQVTLTAGTVIQPVVYAQ